MENVGRNGRQDMRQVLRDLLDFQKQSSADGDQLLLLLSLVNVFGVIDLLGKKHGMGEGQSLDRLVDLVKTFATTMTGQNTSEEAGTGLRAIPGGKALSGFFGKEGMKSLMELVNNREFIESVLPSVMRNLCSAPPVKDFSDNEKETPAVRKGREVIRWDFGRSDSSQGRDDAG
ncbi:MAG: hypothetical protein AB1426_06810 [Bacillota bacterium]